MRNVHTVYLDNDSGMTVIFQTRMMQPTTALKWSWKTCPETVLRKILICRNRRELQRASQQRPAVLIEMQ
jgi:hypothetical protein